MNLEAAVQQDMPKLEGDLISRPKPERYLCNSDVYGLEWAIPHAGAEAPFLRDILRQTQEVLRAELLQADPLLNAVLLNGLGPQFRSRPDFQREKVAVEQWLPALDCWMVNGYFDLHTPPHKILEVLWAGDPRRKTAEEEIAERREAAQKRRESNERASADKVLGAIDALTDKQVQNFVEVEQALHTGENITVRGDDRRRIEHLTESTRDAAYSGDVEAQRVLTAGQRDNPTCILPTTNPLRHRHRSELQGGK